MIGWDTGAVRLPLVPAKDTVRTALRPLLAMHDLAAPQPV